MSQPAPLSPNEVTNVLLDSKRRLGLTFNELAEKVQRNKVWVTAALMGQHPMDSPEADTILIALGLTDHPRKDEMQRIMVEIPFRGTRIEFPPKDPTVYRLQEILQIYGPVFKALIHEELGDGIMSGVDLKIDLKKNVSETEERVVITLDGRFLRYRKW